MSRLVSDLQPLNMQAVRIADGRPMAGIKTSSKCSQPQKSPPACWASEVSSFERSTDRRFLKSTNQWSIFFGLIPASATRTLTALLHLLSAELPPCFYRNRRKLLVSKLAINCETISDLSSQLVCRRDYTCTRLT